ncbi:MAG: zinc ribbon domain-containing protein [Syntrophomonas sp.]|nr:zinc ribbon domain-containing protein [Syntrophomonas sp.]
MNIILPALLTLIEGTLAGLFLVVLPDYVPMLLAVVAFMAYVILRGTRKILMLGLFWLSVWGGMLAGIILRNHSVQAVNWQQAANQGIDLGLIMIATILILYLSPLFKNKLGRIAVVWSASLAIALGVLLAWLARMLQSQVDFTMSLVLLGGLIVLTLGEGAARLVIHILIFGLAYVLTLFFSMSGLDFMHYSPYEFVLLFLPYYGVLLLSSFLPLLSSYANENTAQQLNRNLFSRFRSQKCPNCGASISGDIAFCTSCGNPIDPSTWSSGAANESGKESLK